MLYPNRSDEGTTLTANLGLTFHCLYTFCSVYALLLFTMVKTREISNDARQEIMTGHREGKGTRK